MDSLLADASPEEAVPYAHDIVPSNEEALEAEPAVSNEDTQPALLDRIGSTKVYLLPDSAQTRTTKRKRLETEEDEDVDMNEGPDSLLRANALFLTGTPISHLPTARIFAYVTHFDAHPIGLEWVNDTSCVLVFESKALARTAHRYLRKTTTEDMDGDGFVTAKSIPVTLWLPEDRISKSLGQGGGLTGTIKIRWAKNDDVKKKGAKKESEFYRKYGSGAGKDEDAPQKRRRDERSSLDDELDAYLGSGRGTSHSPPPANARTDQASEGGSHARGSVDLMGRISSGRRDAMRSPDLRDGDEQGNTRRGTGRRRNVRPRKTRKELDDELDAFLNEKD